MRNLRPPTQTLWQHLIRTANFLALNILQNYQKTDMTENKEKRNLFAYYSAFFKILLSVTFMYFMNLSIKQNYLQLLTI